MSSERHVGDILSGVLIFDRPDLLEKCPEEVQEAIKIYNEGKYLLGIPGKTEEGRQKLEKAFDSLKVKEEK